MMNYFEEVGGGWFERFYVFGVLEILYFVFSNYEHSYLG